MDAQGLRRAGKGDCDGHAADALRPVGQIEHSGTDRAGNLCPSLLGLFSLEAHHGLTIHDAEDVRTVPGTMVSKVSSWKRVEVLARYHNS